MTAIFMREGLGCEVLPVVRASTRKKRPIEQADACGAHARLFGFAGSCTELKFPEPVQNKFKVSFKRQTNREPDRTKVPLFSKLLSQRRRFEQR
jgi:hypothetical protein